MDTNTEPQGEEDHGKPEAGSVSDASDQPPRIADNIQKPERGKEVFFSETFSESTHPLTPCFWTSTFRLGEIEFLLFKLPGWWYFVMAALEG